MRFQIGDIVRTSKDCPTEKSRKISGEVTDLGATLVRVDWTDKYWDVISVKFLRLVRRPL